MGSKGQFLRVTEVHQHYGEGHSKVRIPREGLPGSSLTTTEHLIHDTKVHLSDKSAPLVVGGSLWSAPMSQLFSDHCRTKLLGVSWRSLRKKRFMNMQEKAEWGPWKPPQVQWRQGALALFAGAGETSTCFLFREKNKKQ